MALAGWFFAWFGFFVAIRELFVHFPSFRRNREGGGVKKAEGLFHELEETLASGLVPSDARWKELGRLEEPWSTLSYDCLTQLRSEGAAVIPTLRRFRELAKRHLEASGEARAKSSQATAQAWVCGGLVPIFALVLRMLLPEVEAAGTAWWFITAAAAGLGLLSGAWIWRMVEQARWGGLKISEREWMLSVLIFGERCLALLRAGRAPDRAWTESLAMLPSSLVTEWGGDPWRTVADAAPAKRPESLRESLVTAGYAFKKAVQASLWDGQPCSERIESAIETARTEMRAFQDRELALLPTRALQPLFILTAPGILALLGFALYLSMSASLGEF